jgi:hypothetical protein
MIFPLIGEFISIPSNAILAEDSSSNLHIPHVIALDFWNRGIEESRNQGIEE